MSPWLRILVLAAAIASGDTLSAASAGQQLRRVADWQMTALSSNAAPIWDNAPFFAGLVEAYKATGDVRYRDYARAWSVHAAWAPNGSLYTQNADDIACEQTYADLYLLAPDDSVRYMVDKAFQNLDSLKKLNTTGRQLWWWCDALFMAPPGVARLASIQQDTSDFGFLHRMYFDTRAFLYDSTEHLYFRDAAFIYPKKVSSHGNKIFWSRGNGWVIGGLARTIPFLSDADPRKPDYVSLFLEISAAVRSRQQTDGLWRAGLDDAAEFPGPETSGSAFFTFALAWGVNRGLLPVQEYAPVVARGWAALNRCVDANGKLGWVQEVGFQPGPADSLASRPFGTGPFLMAGCEIMRSAWILDSTPPAAPQTLIAEPGDRCMRLSWSPAADPQSGVKCYRLYGAPSQMNRAFISETVDDTCLVISQPENTQWDYAVSAVNSRGLESPLAQIAAVSTGSDTSAPGLVESVIWSANEIRVAFSEPVDSVSALNPGHYSLDNGIHVVSVRRDSATSLTLVCDSFMDGVNYHLSVSGVTDASAARNVMAPVAALLPYRTWADDFENGERLDWVSDAWPAGRNAAPDTFWRVGEDMGSNALLIARTTYGDNEVPTIWRVLNGVTLRDFVLTFRARARGSNFCVLFGYKKIDSTYYFKADSYRPNAGLFRYDYRRTTMALFPSPVLPDTQYADYRVVSWKGAVTVYRNNVFAGRCHGSREGGVGIGSHGTRAAFDDFRLIALNPDTSLSAALPATARPSRVFRMDAYPNPFNPSCRIMLEGMKGSCPLRVFNAAGALVRALVARDGSAEWNAAGMPSGVYVLAAETKGVSARRKIILMK